MNYLIYGNSYTLIDREIEKLVGSKKRETYYLDEVDISSILEDLGYASMFDNEKVLVLKNFNILTATKGASEENIDKLLSYLETPNENTTLVFVSSEKVSSSRGPLKKLVSKLKVIETPIITKPYELSKLLGNIIKDAGYAISGPTLESFANRCSSNYDIALKEFQKLMDIKGNDKLIKDEDILNYVSNYNTSDIFGFKEKIVSRDVKGASRMLEDLETSKMEVIPLVVMLAKEYQTIYNIKLLCNKGFSNDKISEELGGMHPYRVKLLKESSSRYKEEELEKIILELCNLDLRLVSEDNLGYDELRKFMLMI